MRRPLRRTLLALATTLLAATAATTTATPSQAATTTAATPTLTTNSGFNDWSCRPSPAHPEPVLLLHGLGGNGPGNMAFLGPALAAAGYCAYAPTYGEPLPGLPVGGLKAVDDSAHEIAGTIDRILATTGATRLDLVGHSEGAFESLYLPKALPGYAAKTAKVVAIAPPTHGTTFANLITLAETLGIRPAVDTVLATAGCVACTELTTGGPAVARLNDGPITRPGIDYTVVASTADALVTPYGTEYVAEPGVTNESVQQYCPLDPVGHIGLAYDGDVAQLVLNALDPAHPGPVLCTLGPLF
ncbi:lipase [Kitasatospora sp. MMS16-BH015]|uniref:esterase/lipase family protein n=1 Tax=Kitasatospora sp. MMS16-BH015 TaxID=2018025 RepID=UPI000CA23717|nr:lipase [Kitasatospora sp. MMS16-BH015]AUG75287.1 lipase [Kitasatospora sp. MMS16-BH015]